MSNAATDRWPHEVAILGVGLLGGSVALALRKTHPCRLVGYSRSREKCDQLMRQGIVDRASASIADACGTSDVVVVAAPVDRIAAMVIEASGASPSACLVTDVGSTKAGIVHEIEQHDTAAAKFVAAHPIAGSEKSGADHADANLFRGKTIVLTPGERTDVDLLNKAEAFWAMTGGVIRQMSPQQHDTHLASVSHVPHLVSALVARMCPPEARPLVGSGWQDITRVAAGDPAMWTAICQENRDAIGDALETYAAEFETLRQTIGRGDDETLAAWLAEAKRIKEQSD